MLIDNMTHKRIAQAVNVSVDKIEVVRSNVRFGTEDRSGRRSRVTGIDTLLIEPASLADRLRTQWELADSKIQDVRESFLKNIEWNSGSRW